MFEGNRESAARFIQSIPRRYYVYVLARPDGSPFYVGKGQGKRLLEHEAEARRHHPFGETNPFKCNVIRKILREGGSVVYRVVDVFDQEKQSACLELEAKLIREFRRLHEGGCLTNLAGGLGNFSGAAPSSIERHTQTLSGEPEGNPERAILNRFLQGIGPVGSVPIKPVAQMSRILPTTPHPNARSATPRCAFALIAAAVASGCVLVPGVHIPRAFEYGGVRAIIENGVARDILKAGMATLHTDSGPSSERFVMDEEQLRLLIVLVGGDALAARGLL